MNLERLAAKINSVGIEINVGQLEKITGDERLKQFYTQIVERLIDALCEFHQNLDNVPSIDGDVNDQSIESFVFDLSASLRHLDCPYENILKGSIESRLTSKNKKLILSFLASELQTAKITASRPVVEEGGTLNLAGKSAYQDLKKLIMVLKMGKPPVDIAPSKLFDQIVKKLESLLEDSKMENLIEKGMIREALTPMHCDKIDALAKIMHQDYASRKNMLITRLSVTLQSFIWAGRGKEKKDQVLALSNKLMAQLSKESTVSIGQVLAARENILILSKTSSGDTRIATEVNRHTMSGSVADRGGRVHEIDAPQRESFAQQDAQRNMPKWSKRQEPPPNQGRGGGRGGGRGNRGGGRGGNRGGHKRQNSGGQYDPRPQYGSSDSNLQSREYYNSGMSRGGHRGGFKRGSFNS